MIENKIEAYYSVFPDSGAVWTEGLFRVNKPGAETKSFDSEDGLVLTAPYGPKHIGRDY
jgi:hypothetical protein